MAVVGDWAILWVYFFGWRVSLPTGQVIEYKTNVIIRISKPSFWGYEAARMEMDQNDQPPKNG